ncbi:response regulator [Trebonia kvetii]|uniref:Response regulator n=1 Tax=Trebonia kvetii TaxID=2480626 RepID=A0A6P2BYD1_9ACTN|nr:response regulator [Trebonia kvetii]TVZ03938.1 response regulator [Trebonia kvetii]
MKSSAFPETSGDAASRGRILIVEDDPEAAEFFRHVLVTRGRFEVTHTPDPVTALALAAAQCWNLLLADLDLPGMSGLELLAALRPITPRLPGIVVTAHPLGLSPALAAPGTVQPDAVLAKPVRADLLLETASMLAARLGRPR